jgi:signal transduction histidine kinase
VKVSYGETILRLAIEDDGLGFAGSREIKGFGVRGMRKRAAAVSAAFEIFSAAGQGTRVLVTAPIPVQRTLNTWRAYISRRLWQHRA